MCFGTQLQCLFSPQMKHRDGIYKPFNQGIYNLRQLVVWNLQLFKIWKRIQFKSALGRKTAAIWKIRLQTIPEQFETLISVKQLKEVNVYLQTSRTRSITLRRTRTENWFWMRSTSLVLWLANRVRASSKGYKFKSINLHFETCELQTLLSQQSVTHMRWNKKEPHSGML